MAIEVNICYPKSELNPFGDPLSTQAEFHQSANKYRMLAGGWGTGKTTALCLEMSKDIAIPNNYILLGRKDLQELKSTTLKEFIDIYEPAIVDHNKQDREIKFANGTVIYYTNLDESREAIKKIQSLNLGAAFIDQAEEITESMFIAIAGRLRRKDTRRCFCGAMNPNGHDWIWRKFVKKAENNYRVFVASTLENKYLPEDYVQSLLDMPENWVKRYVHCSFDDFEGLVFNEFNEINNVADIYEPSSNDSHIHILDYGFRNPTAILYAATNYDGITYVYNEYYQPGRLITDISHDYKQNKHWLKAEKRADPSIAKTERDGNNVKREFANNGIYWLPADNNVAQGINRVNELFKQRKLYICKNCIETLNEIGDYRFKQLRPGQETNESEQPVKKDDHAMDCLRYLANYLHAPVKKIPPKPESPRNQAMRLHKTPRSITRF